MDMYVYVDEYICIHLLAEGLEAGTPHIQCPILAS